MTRRMNSARTSWLPALLLAGVVFAGSTPEAKPEAADANGSTPEQIMIFAAASLAPAITELAQSFTEIHGIRIRISVASSVALARQIEAGAPADLFLSADQGWIDYLAERGDVVGTSRLPVASNRLVIARTEGGDWPELTTPHAVLTARQGWIVVGDPDLSPLGHYTFEALNALNLTVKLKAKLAPAANARAALALLATGNADLGILYKSDAGPGSGVEIIMALDETLHSPIIYFAVSIREGSAVQSFMEFLGGNAATATFARFGFGPAPPVSKTKK